MIQQERNRELRRWIIEGEDWLISRVLAYAKRQGYTRYTSTLEEAWRISIRELSNTLAQAIDLDSEVTEFRPDESFADDPLSKFSLLEAARHRERGIDLTMFLGLFKYYRQSYLDRVGEAAFSPQQIEEAQRFVTRIFDRLEIAFCSAWSRLTEGARVRELQEANRRMTNEKNRFLTVTESLGSPVILLDETGQVAYVNQAAAPILDLPQRPGSFYYDSESASVSLPAWLSDLVSRLQPGGGELRAEHLYHDQGGDRIFEVRVHPMLDVSDKFQGTVVILHDISALRRAEQELASKAKQLERLSHTDSLTGLLNRRGLQVMAEQQLLLVRRTGQPLALLYGDVGNLKWINDKFGHAVGDAALTALAKALERSFRAADVVARVGGDEFVVLLPGGSATVTDEMLDRIHQELVPELRALGEEIALSLSTGWARFDPERHQSFEQLLAEADSAMYEAKRRRRSAHPVTGNIDQAPN